MAKPHAQAGQARSARSGSGLGRLTKSRYYQPTRNVGKRDAPPCPPPLPPYEVLGSVAEESGSGSGGFYMNARMLES